MNKKYNEKDAAIRAIYQCSSTELCCSQMAVRLKNWGQSPEAIARILNMLLREKYIDESRYARAYALDKFRFNGWGRTKIRYYLQHLGISQDDIHQAIYSIPDDEYRDFLTNLLATKSRSVKAPSDYERKAKLIRFAIGRGFDRDLIMSCLP